MTGEHIPVAINSNDVFARRRLDSDHNITRDLKSKTLGMCSSKMFKTKITGEHITVSNF
jgi:hypothetical protein